MCFVEETYSKLLKKAFKSLDWHDLYAQIIYHLKNKVPLTLCNSG